MPRSRRASRPSSEPADGVTMTPCTPCSSNSRRYRASRSGSSSDELSMSVYSSAASRSSTPRATSVKNGLAMSSTIAPTVWMVPARSCRAEALRTNCSSSMATSTRSRVVLADLVGAVEHVGDGADGDSGPLGDVRDGGSAVRASPCRRRHRPSSPRTTERAPDASCPPTAVVGASLHHDDVTTLVALGAVRVRCSIVNRFTDLKGEAMQESQPTLVVHGLVKHFGPVVALARAELEVRPGRDPRARRRERRRASRRWSRSSPASTSRPRGRCSSTGSRWSRARRPTPGTPASRSSTRSRRCSRTCPSRRTCSWAACSPVAAGSCRRKAMRDRTRELLATLGVEIDPDRPALGLSIADQQLVEIVKAVSLDAKRAGDGRADGGAQSGVEVERLFAVARQLRDRGRGGRVHLAPVRRDLRAVRPDHRDARRRAREHAGHRRHRRADDRPADGRAVRSTRCSRAPTARPARWSSRSRA